jgi:hypothetical protein
LLSEHEDIALVKINKNNLAEVLENGSIRDAKTIVALQWLMMQSL